MVWGMLSWHNLGPFIPINGCGQTVFVAWDGSKLSEMTWNYLSGSHNKSWSNSLNAGEKDFSTSCLIFFSIGLLFTGAMGGNAAQQFLVAATV